ncbi:hypothetical protein [Arcticibacter sp. MXS-1]|uniref:hypothetical protein n=1 Tax=Arcticibacter sp. MXS-1 TaxID=3341726 RepID=UPI0035A89B45
METLQHLRRLGDEALQMESIYLSLKIEKALTGGEFEKEAALREAEELWKEIRNEYYSFLDFLQGRSNMAA